jgi:prepilin-type N-terminal cleavage/methylation domain-containing protein
MNAMTPGRQDRPGGKKVHGGVSRARSRGFTLIEVLVVIGIIAVLAALLIPIVGKVHQAAYQASTQSEITQIVSACHNYYEDFRAYPGPVSNSEIESLSITTTPSSYSQYCDIAISSTGGSSGPQQLLNGGTTAQPTPVLGFFTGSENLVLGLLGGLWHNPNNGNNTLEFVNGTPPGVRQLIGLFDDQQAVHRLSFDDFSRLNAAAQRRRDAGGWDQSVSLRRNRLLEPPDVWQRKVL